MNKALCGVFLHGKEFCVFDRAAIPQLLLGSVADVCAQLFAATTHTM